MLVVKNGCVDYNGVSYVEGKELPKDFDTKEAKRLIGLGVVEEKKAEKSDKNDNKTDSGDNK